MVSSRFLLLAIFLAAACGHDSSSTDGGPDASVNLDGGALDAQGALDAAPDLRSLPDLGPDGGPDAQVIGICARDSDCAYRASGCCGVCANTNDKLPLPIVCGMPCPNPPPCVCINNRCGTGTLPGNAVCDPTHDLCGAAYKCCATCCGVPQMGDGGSNPDPRCVRPLVDTGKPICPIPA